MRTARRALRRTWVRACVLVVSAVVVVVGLYVVCGTLVEAGHRAVGDAVGDVDFASFLIALFLGPAWVLRAFGSPTPPEDDGPPRGGIVPFRARPPRSSGTLEVVEDRPERAARVRLRRAVGGRADAPA